MTKGNSVWQWFRDGPGRLAKVSFWTKRGDRRRLFRKVAALSQLLAERNARTEQDFVRLGDALRLLYADSTGLAGLVRERAEALRLALQESRLTGEHGLAAQMLHELHTVLDEVSTLVCTLRETRGALGQLQGQVQNILRIGVYLNSSVVGFSIESARHPDCQQAFGAFVEELRTLATRVLNLGEEISQDAKDTHTIQARNLGELSAGFERLRHLVEDLESTARKTSEEARQLLDTCFDALRDAQDCASAIVQHTDEAVFQLQSGDIIRQKSEHIIAALDEAAPVALTGSYAEMASILKVQAHQIEAIVGESHSAHARLTNSFESIASETIRLSQALRRARNASAGHGAASHPLDEFVRDCQRMHNLQQQGRSLGDRARATADKAATAASRLTRHFAQLSAINFDMHLQALNAIIKTAALGRRGATLEVLSSQVDRLFRDSNDQVSEILATLDLVKVAPPSNGSEDSPTPSVLPASPGDKKDGAFRSRMDRIYRAHQEFQAAEVDADRLVQNQQQSIEKSRADLEFLSDLAGILSAAGTEIHELSRSLKPVRKSDRSSLLLVPVDQRYTMQSERDVHERFAQGLTPEAAAQPVTPTNDHPDFAFRSSFTLQEGGKPCPPQNSLPAGEDRPAVAVGAATPKEHGLGDNVDLF